MAPQKNDFKSSEDPELLIELLKQMAEDPGGHTLVHRMYGDSEAMRIFHHCELLEDARHAVFMSDSVVRITREGRDFLSAVRSKPEAKATFIQSMKNGLPFATAVAKAIEAFRDLIQ